MAHNSEVVMATARFTKIRVLCTHPDGEELVSPEFDTQSQVWAWCAERADEGCSSFGQYGIDPNDPTATAPEVFNAIERQRQTAAAQQHFSA